MPWMDVYVGCNHCSRQGLESTSKNSLRLQGAANIMNDCKIWIAPADRSCDLPLCCYRSYDLSSLLRSQYKKLSGISKYIEAVHDNSRFMLASPASRAVYKNVRIIRALPATEGRMFRHLNIVFHRVDTGPDTNGNFSKG